jgi:predicted permease
MNDLRFAFRQLLKNPGFTLAAVLMLAVSIGATTAIYSALHTTIIDPLPGKEGDRLMTIRSFNPTKKVPYASGISPPTIKQLRQHQDIFGDLAVFDAMLAKYRGGEFIEMVRGAKVSANFFKLWQIQPLLGRAFSADEERSDAKVVVLSHAFWRTRLGSDPQVVGKSIEFDAGWIGAPYERYTVIGVMPRHFVFPQQEIYYWVPKSDPEGTSAYMRNYGAFFRLPTASSAGQAQAILGAIATRDARDDPKDNQGWLMRLHPVSALFADEATRQRLWTLFAVIGLVWLIACANVANLLFARAEARQHEMGVRAALGAGRGRLVRQLLTESLLLAFVGGLCGLFLTRWGIDALSVFLGGIRLKALTINAAVFAAAMALCAITGIVFGLAPAWHAARPHLFETLKQTAASSTQALSGRWFLRGAIVAELAFAVVILSGAGLMIRSVISVLRSDLGYDPRHLLMAVAVPSAEVTKDSQTYKDFIHRLGESYARLPGVQAIGIRTVAGQREYVAEGDDRPVLVRHEGSGIEDQNLFTALGVPLLEGRFLGRADAEWRAVVVNQILARTFWPGQSAIGKRLRPAPGSPVRITGEPRDVSTRVLEVVGVVGDVRLDEWEKRPQPTLYRMAQDAYATLHYDRFYLRTAMDPVSLIRPIHAAISQADAAAIHRQIQIVSEELYRSTQGRRFFTFYMTLYGVVGLVLATIGLYGTMAYGVQRRTREFGIRMALGSTRPQVLALVMKDGIRLSLVGLTAGLAGALAATRLLQSQLYEVAPRDPLTFGILILVLFLAVTVASLIPAHRATRINPMEALRYE